MDGASRHRCLAASRGDEGSAVTPTRPTSPSNSGMAIRRRRALCPLPWSSYAVIGGHLKEPAASPPYAEQACAGGGRRSARLLHSKSPLGLYDVNLDKAGALRVTVFALGLGPRQCETVTRADGRNVSHGNKPVFGSNAEYTLTIDPEIAGIRFRRGRSQGPALLPWRRQGREARWPR